MNGRSIAVCALALAFVAVSGTAAVAQDRGQDRHSGEGATREGDHGANSQGGHTPNEADRHVEQQQQFNDADRQITRDWARQHARHPKAGWRQKDRLTAAMQGRLRRGERLDPQLRKRIHWVPSALSRRYGPAPRGYRYAMIGGNIVMLDKAYQVHDVFSVNISF